MHAEEVRINGEADANATATTGTARLPGHHKPKTSAPSPPHIIKLSAGAKVEAEVEADPRCLEGNIAPSGGDPDGSDGATAPGPSEPPRAEVEGPEVPWPLVQVSHSILLQSGALRRRTRSALRSLEADLMAEEESLRLERARLAGGW